MNLPGVIIPSPELEAEYTRRYQRDKLWKEETCPKLFSHDYNVGQVVDLYASTPLPSNECRVDLDGWPGETSLSEYNKIGHLQWCLNNNPVVSDERNPLKSITLIAKLKGEIGEPNSHVWIAKDSSNEKQIIAKFFDPLYTTDTTRDPPDWAQRSASREFRCYERFKEHWKTLVPEFYGMFLARLPFPTEGSPNNISTRNVFVILIEYIHGKDLHAIDPKTLKPETRKAITLAGREMYTFSKSLGVNQMDFAPRNFILRNEATIEQSTPELTMFDFQFADPYDKPWAKWDPTEEGKAKRMEKYEKSAEEFYFYTGIDWKVEGWCS